MVYAECNYGYSSIEDRIVGGGLLKFLKLQILCGAVVEQILFVPEL